MRNNGKEKFEDPHKMGENEENMEGTESGRYKGVQLEGTTATKKGT